ncbi:UNVERIFIED_CONTAM: Eukaryotic translation initiation factor 3 subunit I [Sesamum angustifolium]|uniref:Serine-threonine kinase receptor-associated protein n=1 Tax=Sesamum angustifolium TaxID=2727405 RepID=A0AAW2IQB7_9LAMI
MRPVLMKGHERPLTFLKYSRDGDLLFSCAKESALELIAATMVLFGPAIFPVISLSFLSLLLLILILSVIILPFFLFGSYSSVIWTYEMDKVEKGFEFARLGDSTRLITGSADQTAKIWDVKTATPLYTFNFDSPARSVDFAVGDKLAAITTDPFMGLPSAIHIKQITRDPEDQIGESVLILKGPRGRINRAVWGPLNRTIISAGEDSVIRIWDSELWDIRRLELIKTYVTERPVNAVAMSPLLDHCLLFEYPPDWVLGFVDVVVLGGGQDASAVTTTDHRAGKFEAKFYDMVKLCLCKSTIKILWRDSMRLTAL